MAASAEQRPILFAYDGSDSARAAIRQGSAQLRNGRRAIVLTVWPSLTAHVGLDNDPEQEAWRTAEEGAELARWTGFDAEPVVVAGHAVWHRIVTAAEELDAGVVVLGSHGRRGMRLVLMGSVAAAVARHARRPVLIVHGAQHGAIA
jgi:nucleotide-binding universal stress UspA family protein